MNKISLNNYIPTDEIFKRLPEFISRRLHNNCKGQNRIIYTDGNSTLFHITNHFTWSMTPEKTFWRGLEDHYINIVIPHPQKEVVFQIKIKNYYLRNAVYETLLRKIKRLGIIEFNIEDFRMFIEFENQIID